MKILQKLLVSLSTIMLLASTQTQLVFAMEGEELDIGVLVDQEEDNKDAEANEEPQIEVVEPNNGGGEEAPQEDDAPVVQDEAAEDEDAPAIEEEVPGDEPVPADEDGFALPGDDGAQPEEEAAPEEAAAEEEAQDEEIIVGDENVDDFGADGQPADGEDAPAIEEEPEVAEEGDEFIPEEQEEDVVPAFCPVSAEVVFVETDNRGGDHAPMAFIGSVDTALESGTRFDLTDENGDAIIDEDFSSEVPGITIKRGKDGDFANLEYTHFGTSEGEEGRKEFTKAHIIFHGAHVFEPENISFERQGDGIGTYGVTGNDEVTREDDAETLTIVNSVVVGGNDSFRVEFIPKLEELGCENNFEPNVENDIEGFVWQDHNFDGLKGENESGVANINVTVVDYKTGEAILGTVLTDEDGRYTFNGLVDGREYRVVFNTGNNTGYFFPDVMIKDANDNESDEIDNDANVRVNGGGMKQGETDVFIFDAVFNDADLREFPEKTIDQEFISASVNRTSTVSGKVWLDTNADGLRGEDETIYEGLEVGVYEILEEEEFVTSATSDVEGFYLAQVEPGTYFAEVMNLPENCSYTVKDADDNNKDDIDSDFYQDGMAIGRSDIFNLDIQDAVKNLDVGIICEEDNGDDNGGDNNGGDDNGGDDNGDNGGEDNNDDEGENPDTVENEESESNNGGSSGSIGRFIGGGNSGRNPSFTGQSVDDETEPMIQSACLNFTNRDLNFLGVNTYADILKDTALAGPGYEGEDQFAVSGYGNTTNESGTAHVGASYNAQLIDVVKILITTGLCSEIETGADMTAGNFLNQFEADVFMTAKNLGLVTGDASEIDQYRRNITTAELVTMIVRSFEIRNGVVELEEADMIEMETVQSDKWYYEYYLKANKIGFLNESLMNPVALVKREFAFQTIVNFLVTTGSYYNAASVARVVGRMEN